MSTTSRSGRPRARPIQENSSPTSPITSSALMARRHAASLHPRCSPRQRLPTRFRFSLDVEIRGSDGDRSLYALLPAQRHRRVR